MIKTPIDPFLKWAGGKRWLVKHYNHLFPVKFKRYIEPFLGSGSVFFNIMPNDALLADSNAALVEVYQAIKDDWKRINRELLKHHKLHSKTYYYHVRRTKFRSPFTRAAQFIYLNRTCWNGLYRVNLQGEFNVPIGTKQDVIMETDDFEGVAHALKRANIVHSDFGSIIDQAKEDDLVFVDPPYTVQHNLNNFIKYNEELFKWKDQIRLRDCVIKAKDRGAKIIVTNAYHASVIKLYKNYGELHRVKRHSVLAADSRRRGMCEELVVLI
jgi:DNA adenine methylase